MQRFAYSERLSCSWCFLGYQKDLYWTCCWHFAHRWAGRCWRPLHSQPAPICWWYTDLHQKISREWWGSCQTSRWVSRPHRHLAEGQLLRMNPTKTQVMWLCLQQQLAKVNVSEVLVALSNINVSEIPQNLGHRHRQSADAVCTSEWAVSSRHISTI